MKLAGAEGACKGGHQFSGRALLNFNKHVPRFPPGPLEPPRLRPTFGLKVVFQGMNGQCSRQISTVRSNPKPLDETAMIIIYHKNGGLKIDSL